MSLATLATVDDVQNRMPRALTDQEETMAGFFLADASAAVRRYTRQDFTQQQTTVRLRAVNSVIDLPQRPVISVDSLARVNVVGDGVIPYSLWVYNGVDKIYVGPISQIINAPIIFGDMSWLYRSAMYEIEYTHGYDEIPDDVVGVTADLVRRIILGPAPGVVGETIGGYSYRIVDGYQPGLISLTKDDKATLYTYRTRRNRTIELGG